MRPGAARERPRFRQDLIAETIDEQGGRFIDVAAPEGGQVFRFYEVEYSLACGMDGERDVAGLVRWAQDELGMTPSQQEIRSIIATLGDLGFIGADAEAEAATDLGLAPGVVAGQPPRPAPTPGIELGAPGAAAAAARGGPAPAAPDFALGAPGSGTQRTTRPTPVPSNDVGLGAPGARPVRPTPAPPTQDVSIDLADHMEIGTDDVKEAVRASKVMSVVEMPPEVDERPTARSISAEPVFDRLPEPTRPPEPTRTEVSRPPEPTRTEVSRPPEPARTEVSRPPEPMRPPEVRVGKSPPSRSASRPPVELPPPVMADRTQKTPPLRAPRQGVSPVLVALLILVLLGGGAFLAWKYLLDKSTTEVGPNPKPTAAPVKPAQPPPPPPPAPTAKVALETPPPDDIKLSRNGVIETILADKTVVKEGDVVVKLVGDRPIEAEIANLGRELKKLQDAIDASTKRRDTAHNAGNKAVEAAAQADITDKQKTLASKQNQLAGKTSELETFLLKAPASGTFSPAVKNGQKAPADTVVAKIQRDAIPVATFHVGNTRSFASNAGVEVAIGKGELRLTCTVVDVGTDTVKVTCPADPELTDGTDVTLKTPAAAAPGAPTEKPAPPAPPAAGSAASSDGAPAGSAAPAAPTEAPAPGSAAGSAAPSK